jgi:hypothetical protein
MALLERLNNEIKKKRPHLKKKSTVSSRQSTVSQINQNDGKIAPVTFCCLPTSKECLLGRIFALMKR